ncbi:MAG: hypothetical protein M1837_001970 [Sclerophora amabilis]|nr:MAG: hypothetical protein M1837_001970 [Sclerophora amabilis]
MGDTGTKTPSRDRPQTLRQAKRAYQKSAHSVQLSERELRQLERKEELEKRAERIRAKERQRRAQRERREENERREREKRRAERGKKEEAAQRVVERLFGKAGAGGSCADPKGSTVVGIRCEEAECGGGNAAAEASFDDVDEMRNCGHPPSESQPRSATSVARHQLALSTPKESTNQDPTVQVVAQSSEDYLADFIVSNTQIERELFPIDSAPSRPDSTEIIGPPATNSGREEAQCRWVEGVSSITRPADAGVPPEEDLPPMSTQELEISAEDLEEISGPRLVSSSPRR